MDPSMKDGMLRRNTDTQRVKTTHDQAAPNARKKPLSSTFESCTDNRANVPFGKISPQYAIEKGSLLSR